MKSSMWLKSDQLRVGFVMKFKNGYKVVVEYLKDEKSEPPQPISSKKVYIQNISWDAIVGFMEKTSNSEGEDVGELFDVFVYDERGKQIRLPKWSKKVDFLCGVSLEKVVDTLYFVRKIKTGVL